MFSQMMPPAAGRTRLGEIFLGEGVLGEKTLQRALAAQRRSGRGVKLGGILLAAGAVTEETLLEALGQVHKCAVVGWETLSAANPTAVALLPAARAIRLNAIPYAFEKKALRVAFLEPSNIAAIDEVAAITGHRVIPAVASEVRLMQAHEKFYGRVISLQFWNIIKRLDAPPRPVTESGTMEPEQPPRVVPPPPPPSFGAAPPEEEFADAAAGLVAEPNGDAGDNGGDADRPGDEESRDVPVSIVSAASAVDPFSDSYSLTSFLADALSFGVLPHEIFEPVIGEDDPHDLGEPLDDSESLDATRPSRRARRAADDDDAAADA